MIINLLSTKNNNALPSLNIWSYYGSFCFQFSFRSGCCNLYTALKNALERAANDACMVKLPHKLCLEAKKETCSTVKINKVKKQFSLSLRMLLINIYKETASKWIGTELEKK